MNILEANAVLDRNAAGINCEIDRNGDGTVAIHHLHGEPCVAVKGGTLAKAELKALLTVLEAQS